MQLALKSITGNFQNGNMIFSVKALFILHYGAPAVLLLSALSCHLAVDAQKVAGANSPTSVCSLDETPTLVAEHESIENMPNVAALRWLYSVTRPAVPAGPHPWGAYPDFLDKMNPSVVKRLRLQHVVEFLQTMMPGSKLFFWCVDEANLASQEEVRFMLV